MFKVMFNSHFILTTTQSSQIRVRDLAEVQSLVC
jgi:hypothetical protein